MKYYYEIYLNNKNIREQDWHNYLASLQEFIGYFKRFKIIVDIEFNKVRYYLVSPVKLPISLSNENFIFKEVTDFSNIKAKRRGIYFNKCSDNIVSLYNHLKIHNKDLKRIVINLCCYDKERCFSKSHIYYEYNNKMYRQILFFNIPSNMLSVDFSSSKSFYYKKTPKYLNIEKIIHMLNNDEESAIFNVDTFPYLESNFFLGIRNYEFYKHSLVIGASGSGKSKFLALLINSISKQKDKYKVVVIDPHDALKDDLEDIASTKVVDFKNETSTIDIFKNNISDINASVELMITLFRSLMSDGYNGRLERVLRYSIYILLMKKEFSFVNLRKLLLDLEYRNNLIRELKRDLPVSVSYFFLTDFNELKTKSYNDAIAPIIAFIDEMQMIPVFNEENSAESLSDAISKNFLTIFSLNRLTLGDKATKTIAGLFLQQLFLLAEQSILKEHLIVVIDEVSVIENPILARFLSELRKYNVSVIISGQYFGQISENLRESILANTNNYYIFRVSKSDALLLEKNLEIKVVNAKDEDDKYKILTNLKNRECLVRITNSDYMYPAFKARTITYLKENIKKDKIKFINKESLEKKEFKMDFKVENDIKIDDIMRQNSTSRRDLKNG